MVAGQHDSSRSEPGPRVAMAPFLGACPEIITLGIRPCLDDYSEAERRLMRTSRRIFFPTPRFVDLFQALDRPSFPNPTTYHYQRSRVLQQLLIQYLAIDHPRTRIYFGRQQKARVEQDFQLPMQVMGPLTGPDSSHRAENRQELEKCLGRYNPVIVQEVVAWERRVELVCVQYECIAILDQPPRGREYRALNSTAGRCDALQAALNLTMDLLPRAQLDDISLEWGYAQGNWQLLGMDRPPRRWREASGFADRHQYICHLVQAGRL